MRVCPATPLLSLQICSSKSANKCRQCKSANKFLPLAASCVVLITSPWLDCEFLCGCILTPCELVLPIFSYSSSEKQSSNSIFVAAGICSDNNGIVGGGRLNR
ncbi:valine--tRNA ligase [Sesbania bispinosa]|nr:valine--tRNA ligase [Sesbania bispinosa]